MEVIPEQWLKQPYSYLLKGLGGVGWDKKEFPNPNLHVYCRDDIRIRVYSMEGWPKVKGGRERKKEEIFVTIH